MTKAKAERPGRQQPDGRVKCLFLVEEGASRVPLPRNRLLSHFFPAVKSSEKV